MDRKEKFLNFIPKNIVSDEFLKFLDENNYFTSPSSCKFHGVYEGGNFDHSFTVTQCLLKYTENLNLKWSRLESPYIIGMFHDLCKMDLYDFHYENGSFIVKTNEFCTDKRHAEKSLDIIKRFLDLTEEEELCILHHMGAFRDKSYWNSFSASIKKYPNVLWTHTADMEASQILGI